MDVLKKVKELDMAIKNCAMSGDSDNTGGGTFDIRWQQVGNLFAVFIEYYPDQDSSDRSSTMICRLFHCLDNRGYDRKICLSPSYDDELYKCIYEHTERQEKTLSLIMDSAIWNEQLVSELIQCYSVF